MFDLFVEVEDLFGYLVWRFLDDLVNHHVLSNLFRLLTKVKSLERLLSVLLILIDG